MTADELRRIRPNVEFNPYIGLKEIVNDVEYTFWFPTGSVDDEGIKPGSTSDLMMASRSWSSEAIARAAWKDAVEKSAAINGQPGSCYGSKSDIPHFRVTWTRAAERLEIAIRGGTAEPYRLFYTLTSRSERPELVEDVLELVSCDDVM